MSKRLRATALLAGLLLLVVSCGNSDGAGAEPAEAGERLPEGTYETGPIAFAKFVTKAVDAGFDPARVDQFFAQYGATNPATLEVTLRLTEGRWVEFESVDGGAPEIGWSGTYEVIDDDTVVATDPCGAITYDYALDGDVLTLDMVDDQCQGFAGYDRDGELIAQTILFGTAPFTRVA